MKIIISDNSDGRRVGSPDLCGYETSASDVGSWMRWGAKIWGAWGTPESDGARIPLIGMHLSL